MTKENEEQVYLGEGIELEDVEIEIEDIVFPVVNNPQQKQADDRDYVDCCFKDFSPVEGMVAKEIRRIVCEGNEEPNIKPGEMAVVFNYKSKPAKGRKSPLAGMDYIHISTPTGPCRIPLHLAEKWGKLFIAAARSAKKSDGLQQANEDTEE